MGPRTQGVVGQCERDDKLSHHLQKVSRVARFGQRHHFSAVEAAIFEGSSADDGEANLERRQGAILDL
eukprot:9488752-Pyramimonas_sp.AAC.1